MAIPYTMEFEKPLAEIDAALDALDREPKEGSATPNRAPAVAELKKTQRDTLKKIYANLTPWETVRVARHPDRPLFRDYLSLIAKDFVELHGDRRFGDDPALVTGFGRIGSHKCLLVGHHKGKDTNEKLACHFGCAHPEGYRKALLKMKLAEKYNLPIVTFVDTPGAYPGLGAEQRGQAEAIAVNLRDMSMLKTPIVTVVIGEGGSGGALGIAIADRIAILEFAYYSVISPEGCSAILWKQANPQNNAEAAAALKLTAKDNKRLGIVDTIIKEPVGGAHRNPVKTAASVERWITDQLNELMRLKPGLLPARRYERFRALGKVGEPKPPATGSAT